MNPKKWSIEKKAFASFVGAFVLLAGVTSCNLYYNRASADNAGWVNHTHDVLGSLEDYWAALLDAESGQRAYVLTGREIFLDSFDSAMARSARRVTEVEREVADNPAQQRRVQDLELLSRPRLEVLRGAVELQRDGRSAVAKAMISSARGKAAMDAVRKQIEAIKAEEQRLLALRSERFRRDARLSLLTMTVGGVLTLGLFGVVIALFRRDLQQRRRTTRALEELSGLQHAMLDSTNYAVISTRADGRIQSFNRGAEMLLGYSADDMISCASLDLFHKPEELATRARARLRVDRGESPADIETLVENARAGGVDEGDWTYMRRDGSEVPVRLSITGIQTERGEVIGFLAIARDITEQTEIHGRLREAHEGAEAASRTKGEFLANMSHEIRTPLNGVMGMTTLLLDTPLSPRQRDFAETIQTSAESLLTLLNDILDFSKIEAGMLRLENVEFDLRQTIEDAVGVLAPKAEEKGLDLAVVLPPEVPNTLRGDPGRLRQVLVNLVGNAVKFTATGEVAVRVETWEMGVDAVELSVCVTDTGIGIAPEAQERLFHSFSQADGSTTRKYGGTGLGLAICRQLVEHMGGEIGVESRPGEGSTFWFTVRFGLRADEDAGRHPLQGLRLLVADGSETVRRGLIDHVQCWGVQAQACERGAEALEILAAAANRGVPFGAVLFGLRLPDMDGMAFAREAAKAGGEGLLRLALTPLGFNASPGEFARAGIHGELRKPVRQSQLFDALNEITECSQAAMARRTSALEGSRPAPGARLRILVAEDNAVNRLVLLQLLDGLGHPAEAVENGRDALARAERGGLDLIFMDCQMPEMDGYAATAAIRRLEGSLAKVPVVALTAHSMAGDREKCLEAGMDDYVSKPIRVPELARVLERFASRKTRPAARLDESILAELEEMPNAAGFLGRLVSLFMQHAPLRLAEASAALGSRNAADFGRALHALKGSGASLGAKRLVELCTALETAAEHEVPGNAPELLLGVEREYEAVREALELRVAAVQV